MNQDRIFDLLLILRILVVIGLFCIDPVSAKFEDPLPRIQCSQGATAAIYAEGLSSPDGLAFDPNDFLYVAEERAGRVSKIRKGGSIEPVLENISSPEGIVFDDSGSLFVVEDVENGRLLQRRPDGTVIIRATGLAAPEGVVWTSSNILYITESNIQYESNPFKFKSWVTAIFSDNTVTRIIESTSQVQFGIPLSQATMTSYAGITIGADGFLYATNELSGNEEEHQNVRLASTDSLFRIDPTNGEQTLFATGLTSPEGIRFSAGQQFPLYLVEEDKGTGDGVLNQLDANGRLSVFCTGFQNIEDVATDQQGHLYVSEDTSGVIIRLTVPPRLEYSGRFSEATSNDGSLAGRVIIKLLHDTFVNPILLGTHLQVTNVPPGLTAIVSRENETQLALALTGQARKHADSDDFDRLGVVFKNGAFMNTHEVSDVGNHQKDDIVIDFFTENSQPTPNGGGCSLQASGGLDLTFFWLIAASIIYVSVSRSIPA